MCDESPITSDNVTIGIDKETLVPFLLELMFNLPFRLSAKTRTYVKPSPTPAMSPLNMSC